MLTKVSQVICQFQTVAVCKADLDSISGHKKTRKLKHKCHILQEEADGRDEKHTKTHV